jgi:hypothetical protein
VYDAVYTQNFENFQDETADLSLQKVYDEVWPEEWRRNARIILKAQLKFTLNYVLPREGNKKHAVIELLPKSLVEYRESMCALRFIFDSIRDKVEYTAAEIWERSNLEPEEFSTLKADGSRKTRAFALRNPSL